MVRRLHDLALCSADLFCLYGAASRLNRLSFLVLAVMIGVMMMTSSNAMAQVSPNELSADPPRGLQLDRAGTIQRFGLGNPELKLTDAQKAQIDKAASALAAESASILQRYPPQQDARLGQDGMEALNQARERFTNAVNNVLSPEQKRTWEAKQSPRRPTAGRDGVGVRTGGPDRPRPRQ